MYVESSRLTERGSVCNGHNVSFHVASRVKRTSLKRLNVHVQNGGKSYVVYCSDHLQVKKRKRGGLLSARWKPGKETRPCLKKSIERTEEHRSPVEDTLSSGKTDAHIIPHAHRGVNTDRGTHGPTWSSERRTEACGGRPTPMWRVRRRVLTQGLDDALSRQTQPERAEKRHVTGRQEAQLLTLACLEAPPGDARWSRR
jgi:hypothetical protein